MPGSLDWVQEVDVVFVMAAMAVEVGETFPEFPGLNIFGEPRGLEHPSAGEAYTVVEAIRSVDW